MPKIKIAAVEYLNTAPFIWGIEQSEISENVELILDYPSRCAEMFKKEMVDIALIPVGALSEVNSYRVITDYCIGCDGEVATVLLVGDHPVESIKTVYLDYQSRTSVKLIQILFGHYWNQKVDFIRAEKGYENKIGGNVAGLIIGDRAFNALEKYPYVYDLGWHWREYTALPFVFALWVSGKKVGSDLAEKLNNALKMGIANIDKLEMEFHGLSKAGVRQYFEENIDYFFDEKKQLALNKFLNYELNY